MGLGIKIQPTNDFEKLIKVLETRQIQSTVDNTSVADSTKNSIVNKLKIFKNQQQEW